MNERNADYTIEQKTAYNAGFEAGRTAGAKADVEQLRVLTSQVYAKGVENGREYAAIDRGDQLPVEHQLVGDPTPYDAAVTALQAASRIVEPVDLREVMPDALDRVADDVADFVTSVAGHLVIWLSEHLDHMGQPADVQWVTGPVSLPKSEAFARGENWPAPAKCTHCGCDMAGTVCSDPWCDRPFATGTTDGPMPEAKAVHTLMACPECRAGKHTNCPGVSISLDDKVIPCPCIDTACKAARA